MAKATAVDVGRYGVIVGYPIKPYSFLASVETIVVVVLKVRERSDLSAQQQTEHCHCDRARFVAWFVEILRQHGRLLLNVRMS